MNKLSRKLFISLLTVAFAVITLGATTFAWFTLSNTARVESFDMQVTAGAGIAISVDDINFSNTLTTAQMLAHITAQGRSIVLANLTTNDGLNFKMMDGNLAIQPLAANNGEYLEFPLYFRTPDQNVSIYMLSTSTSASTGVSWKNDIQFYYPGYGDGSDNVLVNTTQAYHASNSLRISFENIDHYKEGGLATASRASTQVVEFDTTDASNTLLRVGASLNLDTTPVGAHDYFEKKTGIELGGVDLPASQLSSELFITMSDVSEVNLANPILNLDEAEVAGDGQTYYYGKVQIRLWIEGWDPDSINAILSDVISATLSFGGRTAIADVTSSASTISLAAGPVSGVYETTIDDGSGAVANSFVEAEYSSATPGAITIDPVTGEMTAVGAIDATSEISVYLPDFGITKTFTVTVVA